jgi:ketosteroid isomerase-like protein
VSQENIEVVRQFLAAFAELDEGLVGPERVEEFIAQDAITTFSGFGFVDARTLRGWEFLEVRTAWMEPYDDFMYEPKEFLDAGTNRVVVTFHQRGKPHGSDSWVGLDYGVVYTVEEGLIRRANLYAPPEKALQAARLPENIELARRGFESFNRTFNEGTPDLFETLDPEIEWIPMSALLEGASYHGHDEVRAWLEEMRRDWTSYEIKPERYLDLDGDQVLTLGSWHARGRGGDLPLDFPQAAWLLAFRNGLVVRVQTFTERRKALQAAGLKG